VNYVHVFITFYMCNVRTISFILRFASWT